MSVTDECRSPWTPIRESMPAALKTFRSTLWTCSVQGRPGTLALKKTCRDRYLPRDQIVISASLILPSRTPKRITLFATDSP